MSDELDESPQANSSLDLREYALLLWHWTWAILLTGIIAGGIAYTIKRQEVPLYTAATMLLVSEPPTARAADTSQSAIVPGNLMAQTYTQMLKDLPVLQQVVERLKIPLNPLALKSMISVTLIQNTQLIQAMVTDTDPQRAAAIANALGDVLAEQIQSLQSVRFAQSKANLTQQISDMEAQLQQISDQIANVTGTAEKSQMDARQIQYRLIYANLVASLEQLRIAESQSSTIVAQVEPATVPSRPVNQVSTQGILLVAFVAMLLACGVIFTANLVDDTVRSPGELTRQVGLPILGAIPHHSVQDAAPVVQVQPYSSVAEAYRTMIINLGFSKPRHHLRRILIASPLPGDGKTTVVANLAVTLAQRGQPTLLVDGDFRWPAVHRALGMPNRTGLSSLLLHPEESLEEHLQITGIKNLRLVSSGPLPPDPAALLGSPCMTSVLERLNRQGEVLLIDTPPALTVTDASLLAAQVDGVLIVVKAGYTNVSAARRMASDLRQQGAWLLGIVVNDIQFKNARYRYYYRDYYTHSTRLCHGEG